MEGAEKLSVEVHNAFAETVKEKFARQDDENRRQNQRLDSLEKEVGEIKTISVSIAHMSENIQNLTKEISRQGDSMNNLANKVEAIEKEPADKWKKAAWIVIAAVIGAAIALIGRQIGLAV